MEVEEEEEKNSFLDHHMERQAAAGGWPPKGFEIARYLNREWKDTIQAKTQEVINIKNTPPGGTLGRESAREPAQTVGRTYDPRAAPLGQAVHDATSRSGHR